ncbi:MAG: response regulator, partial [Rhizobiales bacterium]|nr:response regulator [Hyphomicrobiales bacterium]
MRILLVEDDRETAAYLLKALKEAGHVPDHAADGEEGTFLAEANRYDVMVVDRMLPKKDGLSLVADARAKGNDTPVLILSALGQV